MKASLVIILVMLGGLTMQAQQQQEPHNGNWWIKEDTKLKQLLYVMGFLDGLNDGESRLSGEVYVNSDKVKFADCLKNISAAYKRLDRYTDNVTVGQMWEGVDDFYKDYRNRSILVSNAIDIVLRAIKGEDVEQLTLFYRKTSG
jgi:hypothetical protein